MFNSETTIRPLSKIKIHQINEIYNIRTEHILTVDNVDLTKETLDMLFDAMDREERESGTDSTRSIDQPVN